MEIYSHFSFFLSVERVRVRREGCRNGDVGRVTWGDDSGQPLYWSAICHGSPLLKKRSKVFHNTYLIFHFQLLFCYINAPWARSRTGLCAAVKTGTGDFRNIWKSITSPKMFCMILSGDTHQESWESFCLLVLELHFALLEAPAMSTQDYKQNCGFWICYILNVEILAGSKTISCQALNACKKRLELLTSWLALFCSIIHDCNLCSSNFCQNLQFILESYTFFFLWKLPVEIHICNILTTSLKI